MGRRADLAVLCGASLLPVGLLLAQIEDTHIRSGILASPLPPRQRGWPGPRAALRPLCCCARRPLRCAPLRPQQPRSGATSPPPVGLAASAPTAGALAAQINLGVSAAAGLGTVAMIPVVAKYTLRRGGGAQGPGELCEPSHRCGGPRPAAALFDPGAGCSDSTSTSAARQLAT